MFKPYNQIIKPEYHKKILAHTSINKTPETLIEHSEKTLEYCDCLIDKLSLKNNINNIFSKLLPDTPVSDLLELVRSIVYYHDLGKVNPVFQKEKMKNIFNTSTTILDSTHSFYGKILFDHLFSSDFEKKYPEYDALFFLLSQTIDRHHTSLRDIDCLYKKICTDDHDGITQKELDDLNMVSHTFFNESKNIPPVAKFCNKYNFKNENYDDIRKIFETQEKQEALFYLYKITYSLLITSDYYATMDYMQNISYFDKISTITPDLISKCETNFYKHEFNQKLHSISNSKKIRDLDICNIDDLNKLRTRILLDADSEITSVISKYPEQKVFYLNIPTGGGKTNISLKITLTLLKLRKNIKKVFYVFPFINLIEQNYDVIKETLCLDDEISSVYSSSTWNIESGKKEEHLQYAIGNEFLNHPFVVMSNVNFFNTFIKSGKTSNYRLVNLANSIVIIDEVQSLNDNNWTLFNDLIMYGSKYLNIHFIIMSATLPKLDALSDVKNCCINSSPTSKQPKLDALSDVKSNSAWDLCNSEIYSDHPLFKNRVTVQYKSDVNDLEHLLNLLYHELDNKMNKILLVVNTIQTSLELYNKIKKDGKISSFGFNSYLLNSTLLPHRQKQIIQKMKGCDKSILISTQSVEAGMDIDCDFGIRDFAIFDSIEQIAGRINRNSKVPNHTAKLIIVNLKKNDVQQASFVYKGSYRWITINKKDFKSPADVSTFLKTRNFNDYYNKVIINIKNSDNDPIRKASADVVRDGVRHLNFDKLNNIDIIEQDSLSVIVDSDILKNEFSNAELKFILDENESKNTISGKYVWDKYNEFIKNFQGGYVDRKINTKIWSSILSKFTINIKNSHGPIKLSEVLNLENGIPLLKNEYYSDEQGIDRTKLDKNSFQIPN